MPEEDEKTPLGWVQDKILTDEILKAMEATEEPDYVYTISVQGHGAYPEEPLYEDPEITVTGAESDEANCMWEYYVNEIHEMDQFVKDLVAMLEAREEPTILLLYGDHLPTMGLEEIDLMNYNLFQTEYVIWDNMGLEREVKNIYAYQAMAEVLDDLDIHEVYVLIQHLLRLLIL